jgi:hypothetical protein
MMATATRGGFRVAAAAATIFVEGTLRENLPFDFFIRLNIPRSFGLGYFPGTCQKGDFPANRVLEVKLVIDSTSAEA